MDIKRPQPKQPIPEDAKKVLSGVIFDVYQWEQEMFDGSKKTFEVARRPDTVAIFPVLSDGRIILVEENQPGMNVSYVGPCGGRIDPGEKPDVAILREMQEEVGYSAEKISLWKAKQTGTPKLDWVIYTFIGKGLHPATSNLDTAGEKIKTRLVTIDELIDMAVRGEGDFDKEILTELLLAKINPEKRKELEDLFRA
jgi:ADP-ribose pyrophosphatase